MYRLGQLQLPCHLTVPFGGRTHSDPIARDRIALALAYLERQSDLSHTGSNQASQFLGRVDFFMKIDHDSTMSDHSNLSADSPSEHQSIERPQNERRRTLRYPFTASVDAFEPKSNAKISGRTSDISLGGCYVDTISPFPVGTIIKIRLMKESVTFEADAKVVLSKVGMGMGVAFISAAPQQIRIFQKWLNEINGNSSPELDVPEQIEKNATQANSNNKQDYVLMELLIALMRKGVLSDDEGKAMLQ